MKIKAALPAIVGLLTALVFGWWMFPHVLYTNNPQPVNFNHALHTGEKVGMSCQDCHGFSENGTFAGIPKTEQCATCHAEASGTTDDEHRFVEDYVKKNLEVPWGVYAQQPDNVYFSHYFHVKTATIDCVRCHGGQGTASGLRPVQVNLLSGYSREIEGTMFATVSGKKPNGMRMDDCIDCHKEHGRHSACIDCHK